MTALKMPALPHRIEPPDKLIVEAHRDCLHKAVVVALDAAGDIKLEDAVPIPTFSSQRC